MIKSISAINYRNERIDMVLDKPELSGFIVRKIDGLGPAKANINVTDTIRQDCHQETLLYPCNFLAKM